MVERDTQKRQLYVPIDTWMKLVQQLVKELKRKEFAHVKKIYAIPKNGFMVAVPLCQQLGWELVHTPEEADLIVDELIDTGVQIRKDWKNQLVAVVYLNEESKFVPDAYVAKKEPDTWLVFWWEKEYWERG